METTQFTVPQLSILEQIEACVTDESISEIQTELMLYGLFWQFEEVYDGEAVILYTFKGIEVINPFRRNQIDENGNTHPANRQDDGEDEDYGDIGFCEKI